jgi:hypothetical protein
MKFGYLFGENAADGLYSYIKACSCLTIYYGSFIGENIAALSMDKTE